jgi:hypothetical protein
MLQFGICNVTDLIRYGWATGNIYHLRRPCYIGLYEQILAERREINPRLQEIILDSFTLSNGVFKRTNNARFGDFDYVVLGIICESRILQSGGTVHDLAVSDGRTACEFFQRFSAKFGTTFDFYATDLCLKVFALRKPKGRIIVVTDSTRAVLQIVMPPFVLPPKIPRRYAGNRILQNVLMRTLVKAILALHQCQPDAVEQREILLVCSDAKRLLENNSNFHLSNHNVFHQAPREYSVVRAMNIFNRSYFSDGELSSGIVNIFRSLRGNGIFIIGSNGDPGSTVNGTIYRKEHDRFVRLYNSGDGSHIDDLITNLRFS